MGGGPPLEGGKALGLSASLWGEQEERYVRSARLANPGRTQGVSHAARAPAPGEESPDQAAAQRRGIRHGPPSPRNLA